MELQLHISKSMSRPYTFSNNLPWNWLITGYSHIAKLKGHLSQYLKSSCDCFSWVVTYQHWQVINYISIYNHPTTFLMASGRTLLSIQQCLHSLPSLAICFPFKVQHYSINPSLLFWSQYIFCVQGQLKNETVPRLGICLLSYFHVTILPL
jgi:hypothetical protein